MTLFAAFTDLTSAVAIANFASLFYYAIANYAALKIDKPRYPRVIPIIGLLTCILLLLFLTPAAWIIGSLTLVIGVVYYLAIKKRIRTVVT